MKQLQLKPLIDTFVVRPGTTISLRKDFDPGSTAQYVRHEESDSLLQWGVERLKDVQERLYAEKKHALLIVLQAMDAAGKDSVIKHVISGLNPQGCHVWSFRQLSDTQRRELAAARQLLEAEK
jgi:polyphosphate kinase 2 (PPK2 family)